MEVNGIEASPSRKNRKPKAWKTQWIIYLKDKSDLMIFDRYANLKYKMREQMILAYGALCGYSCAQQEGDRSVHQGSDTSRSS